MSEIIQPNRRGFITGLSALIAAPAIIKVSTIMPVKVYSPVLTIEEILLNSTYGKIPNIILYGTAYIRTWYDEVGIIHELIPTQEIINRNHVKAD